MKNFMLKVVAGTAALTMAASLAACENDDGVGEGKSDKGGDTSSFAPTEVIDGATKSDEAAAALPEEIRKAGVLKVGGETTLPPYLYKGDGGITGIEADFMQALGTALDVKVDLTNTGFDSMIIGLTSNRLDVAMSDFSDTTERQQQVDFIDYTQSGQQLIVLKDNPKDITTVADLCGLSAAGPTGSLSVDLAKRQSKKCEAAGKPPVDVQDYPSGSEAQLALENGRVDAMGTDYAIAQYQVEQSKGKLETTGGLFEAGYHGAAVKKDDEELEKALTLGFEHMIEDGAYEKILEKWDVPQMAMDKPEVNAKKDGK